jgi:hypothetical protein
MAQCGVPTAAWPFACGDVDLNNGLHWDDTTNKFWVEPGMSTQVPARTFFAAPANIDAASPNGNGLYWDAAKCKVWARPESCTNHNMAAVGQTRTPLQPPFWQYQTGPYGDRHAIWWSAAYLSIPFNRRQNFTLIDVNTGIVTMSNTSPIARRVQIQATYPRIQDYVTLQSAWCELVGEVFYNIYPTGGPVGAWTALYGTQISHVPFAYDPDDASNSLASPGYPFSYPYGGGVSGLGSGWITASSTGADYLSGGGHGLVAAITELGTVGHYVILQPGESVRATFRLNAVTGAASPYIINPGPPPLYDPPWYASYTSLLNFGFTQMTLI